MTFSDIYVAFVYNYSLCSTVMPNPKLTSRFKTRDHVCRFLIIDHTLTWCRIANGPGTGLRHCAKYLCCWVIQNSEKPVNSNNSNNTVCRIPNDLCKYKYILLMKQQTMKLPNNSILTKTSWSEEIWFLLWATRNVYVVAARAHERDKNRKSGGGTW